MNSAKNHESNEQYITFLFNQTTANYSKLHFNYRLLVQELINPWVKTQFFLNKTLSFWSNKIQLKKKSNLGQVPGLASHG